MSRTRSPRPRRTLRPGPLPGLLVVALCAGAGAISQLDGQAPDRAALLASARSEFDDAVALELLVQAADPSLAPPDSLWAVTVHDLAFTLVRMGDEAAAELWLRWAARHASQWPLDREWFPPAVATIWDRARLDVGSDRVSRDYDPYAHSTAWDWDGAAASGLPGAIGWRDEPPSGVTVLLVLPGEDPLPGGPGVELEAGSYRVSISADGYETLHLDREILPGVRTLLDVDLVPSLSEASRDEARSRTAIIRWGEGAQGCSRGVVVGDGRSVLTSLRGLGSRSGLTVQAVGEQAFVNVPVVRTDERLDLALLRLEGAVTGLQESAAAEGSRHGWVALGSGCGTAGDAWARLEATGSSPDALWVLQPGLPATALGAPLLHPGGGLLGIVTDVDTAVPLRVAGPLILGPFAAQQEPVLGSTTPPRRAGLPWKWIGAGVGLAGIGAAIAAGGGGGDGGSGPPPRGTLVITFPGG